MLEEEIINQLRKEGYSLEEISETMLDDIILGKNMTVSLNPKKIKAILKSYALGQKLREQDENIQYKNEINKEREDIRNIRNRSRRERESNNYSLLIN